MRGPASKFPRSGGGYTPPPPPTPGRDPFGPKDPGDLMALLTPKSVVSMAIWIMMFGLGAGVAGLILFAVYQGQVNNLRSELLESQEELKTTLEQKIQEGGPPPDPNEQLNVSGSTPADPLKGLVAGSAGAIVGILGRNSAGGATAGTGVVVNAPAGESWVLTSYKLVAGVEDAQGMRVRYRNSNLVAEVYEIDPGRDLALLIFRVSAERSLRFSRLQEPQEGDPVWVLGSTSRSPFVSGVAAKLTTVTAGSLGLDTEIPEDFVGAPVVGADGRVLGIITSAGSSPAAASATLACQKVLRCPGERNESDPPPAPAPEPSPEEDSPTPPGSSPAEPDPPAGPAPPVGPGEVLQPPPSDPNAPDVPIG